MKKTLLAALACCIMTSCGQQSATNAHHSSTDSCQLTSVAPAIIAKGDSSIYGLACDGSTDSVLVLLSPSCERLDTLDIIQASDEHRIIGRPHIGDDMAVIVKDSTVWKVVNISRLTGQWCYMVTPTLRRQFSKPLPDSILQRLMAPKEYSLLLKRNGNAIAYGMQRRQTTDDLSPVEYPALKRYISWQFLNGSLILVPDTSSEELPDTVDVLYLRRDSLVLRINGQEQGYYRKKG